MLEETIRDGDEGLGRLNQEVSSFSRRQGTMHHNVHDTDCPELTVPFRVLVIGLQLVIRRAPNLLLLDEDVLRERARALRRVRRGCLATEGDCGHCCITYSYDKVAHVHYTIRH